MVVLVFVVAVQLIISLLERAIAARLRAFSNSFEVNLPILPFIYTV